MSNNLKRIRKNKNLTLQSLADISGISKSYLHELEAKGSMPSLEIAYDLSEALNVTVYEIWTHRSHDEIAKIKNTLGTLISYLHRELGTQAATELFRKLD